MPVQITPLGHSCFEIKGDNLTIITDPYAAEVGKLRGGLTADIVTTSHDHADHNATTLIEGKPRIFDWPGEYEVGGVQIRGYASFHDGEKGTERGENIIFVFRFSEATVAHLGDLGHALEAETIEAMGDVDILLCPVGGEYTIDAKAARKVVESIEPRIVVPMHFADPDIKVDGIAPVDEFLRIMGASDLVPEKTLKIKHSELPVEGMQIVYLHK